MVIRPVYSERFGSTSFFVFATPNASFPAGIFDTREEAEAFVARGGKHDPVEPLIF